MNHLFTFLVIVVLASDEALAVALTQKPLNDSPGQTALQEKISGMNADEFAALMPKEIAKKTGKKMSWREKILFKIMQKRIKKQLAKGVQPPQVGDEAGGLSKMGTISIILALGGVGLVLLALALDSILPVFFGAACVIIGLILGIIGLKKDKKKAAATVGTVLSGALLVGGITVFVGFLIWLANEN